MTTRTSGQHNQMVDLCLLTHGPVLGGQVTGSLMGFVGREVLIEGVRDAIDLDFVGAGHVVDDGDFEHFRLAIGDDGRDCDGGFAVLESLSCKVLRVQGAAMWACVQRFAGLNLQKIAAPSAPRLHHGEKGCGATCTTAPHHTNPLEGWCAWCWCSDFLHVRKRVRGSSKLRHWPILNPQFSSRWRVQGVQ